MIACRWGARADALEHALVHARLVPEARSEVGAIVALLAQALHYGPTPVLEAIERCRAFRAEADADPALQAGLDTTIAGLIAMRGEFDEARRLYAGAVRVYDELGLRFRRAVRTLVGAEIETLGGDLDAAERELRLGYETLAEMGESGVRGALAAFLADVLLARGDVEGAERFVVVSAEATEDDDVAACVVQRAVRACVRAARGELDEAERLAAAAVERAERTDFLALKARALEAAAEVRAAGGADNGAEELLERARRLHAAKGNVISVERLSSAPPSDSSGSDGAAVRSPAPSPGGRDATG